MPWEKSFDTEEALGKAMAAFWARGYEATSMQDLVDCMGIGRGSIYAAFGDKRRLFMRALALYDDRHRRVLHPSQPLGRLGVGEPDGVAVLVAAGDEEVPDDGELCPVVRPPDQPVRREPDQEPLLVEPHVDADRLAVERLQGHALQPPPDKALHGLQGKVDLPDLWRARP